MDKLTAAEIEGIRAHQAAAQAEISRLCRSGHWRMCIPAQEMDSDHIFHQLCGDTDRLIAYIATLERIIYECVSLTDIMRTDANEELYRDIVVKFEKAQGE